jgi:hypothetical protein
MKEMADGINKIKRSISLVSMICIHGRLIFSLAGDQLQEKIRLWLHNPDPSTNHNVALRQRHDGTAAWFTKGSTFEGWRAQGSLLWIHGKRKHFSDIFFFAYP